MAAALAERLEKAERLGVGHPPRGERLATHAVLEMGFPLHYQHACPALGHGLGESRSAEPSADRDDVVGLHATSESNARYRSESARMSMSTFWRRHWFLVALAAVCAAAIVFPAGGTAVRQAPLALPLLTATSLFLSSVTLETAGLREGADVRGLALGLSSTYVVAPLLAVALVGLLGPANGGAGSEGYHFFEAMMIVAAQASTIASAPALTLVAGGNQALALLITLSSNLLTSLVTPLLLRLTVGTVVAFPVGRMMREDALVVLLPVVAGQVAHRLFWPRLRASCPRSCACRRRSSSSSSTPELPWPRPIFRSGPRSSCPSWRPRRRCTLRCSFGTIAARRGSGSAERNRTAVVFCGSQKTLPNGIYLWDTFFPANPHGALALVCYHLFQLVLDSLLVPWLSPRHPRLEELEEAVDGA